MILQTHPNYIFILTIVCMAISTIFIKYTFKEFLKSIQESMKTKVWGIIYLSLLIGAGITLGIMNLLSYNAQFDDLLGGITQKLDNIFLNYALVLTFFYLIFKLIRKKLQINSHLDGEIEKKAMKNLFRVILVTWVIVFIFLLNNFLYGGKWYSRLIGPSFDPFFLGIQWSILTVIILSALIKLVFIVIPIEKRPSKELSEKSSIFASILSIGVWFLQLLIVEVYLKRFFDVEVYTQDIRVLAAVVFVLYFGGYFASMKFIYIPQAIKADEEFMGHKDDDEVLVKKKEVLKVENLVTRFYTEEGIVQAVDGISFNIMEGEVLGLVGETGCGKSVTGLSILRLVQHPGKIVDGIVEFDGEDLLQKSDLEILPYRGDKITMIFQDPLSSLNPVFTISKQISEVYLIHKKKELLIEASKSENSSVYQVARKWTQELLRNLNIPSPEAILDRYPHELSGGMRQRIQIAMGIASSPRLLIADEPTTALDVTVQNQILKLMKNLKKDYKTSILFITHDLGVISKMWIELQ